MPEVLLLPFRRRYAALTRSAVFAAPFLILAQTRGAFRLLFAAAAAPILAGLHDLIQTGHGVLRNDPIAAHFRFLT